MYLPVYIHYAGLIRIIGTDAVGTSMNGSIDVYSAVLLTLSLFVNELIHNCAEVV